MTEEHLPPRSAGNDKPITAYTEREGVLQVLRSFKEGHTVPSLCEECNNKASARGLPQAYTRWQDDTVGHLNEAGAAYQQTRGGSPNDLFSLGHENGGALWLPMEHGTKLGSTHIENLNPGKIARQVLGMMLAVQSGRVLYDGQPQLASAYHSDGPTSIAPFALHVALANCGLNYFTDSVTPATMNLASGSVSTSGPFWALSFPPFLLFLTSEQTAPIEATRIDQWFAHPLNEAFSKHDRKVSYPISDQRELLVAALYAAGQRLKEAGGTSNQPDETAPTSGA